MAKVKAVASMVISIATTVGNAAWSAISALGPVLSKGWEWVKGVAGVVRDVWTNVQGYIEPIWKLYKDYVSPVIEFTRNAVDLAQKGILLIQGKLDALWKKVEHDLFGPLQETIKEIKDLRNKIADVVEVFRPETAEMIRAFGEEEFKKVTAFIDSVHEKTIGQVREWIKPLADKINELSATFHLYTDKLTALSNHLETIFAATFEAPGVLKRSSIQATSQRWGMDLFNDLFSGVIPLTPITPSEERTRLIVDAVVDKHITTLFAEDKGEWQDASQRIDEEIQEAFFGALIPEKTKLTVPKLPQGKELEKQIERIWVPR